MLLYAQMLYSLMMVSEIAEPIGRGASAASMMAKAIRLESETHPRMAANLRLLDQHLITTKNEK